MILKFTKSSVSNSDDKHLVAHYAMDCLRRYLFNTNTGSSSSQNSETKTESLDYFILALVCLDIASKNLSVHYGGFEILTKFYLEQRPRDNSNSGDLPPYSQLREKLVAEFKRVEFHVIGTLSYQLTPVEALPLNGLRKFIKKTFS
jgi:hypothetical protein